MDINIGWSVLTTLIGTYFGHLISASTNLRDARRIAYARYIGQVRCFVGSPDIAEHKALHNAAGEVILIGSQEIRSKVGFLGNLVEEYYGMYQVNPTGAESRFNDEISARLIEIEWLMRVEIEIDRKKYDQ